MLADEQKATVDGYARSVLAAWVDGGRSIAEFAERAGVTPQSVSQIRHGQWGVGQKGLRGFARVLGIDLGELERRAVTWATSGRPALTADALPPKGER